MNSPFLFLNKMLNVILIISVNDQFYILIMFYHSLSMFVILL